MIMYPVPSQIGAGASRCVEWSIGRRSLGITRGPHTEQTSPVESHSLVSEMAKKSKRPVSPRLNADVELISVVLPGDEPAIPTSDVKLGTGLHLVDGGHVRVTVAGQLVRRNQTYFVRNNPRHYIPPLSVHDRVVGVIVDRMGGDGVGGDLYRVDIGGPHHGTLSSLAFEGATKRHKPQFQPGQIIYARVDQLHPSLDPVLSCQVGPHDPALSRKDWMTNEGMYGELRGGHLCRLSMGLARALLQPDCLVLEELGRHKIPFEVAIGVNGYVWIHSASPRYTILIQNALQNSQVLTPSQTKSMVESLVYTIKKQEQQESDAMSD